MNTKIHNIMQDHIHDAEETRSFSDFHIEDATIVSQELSKTTESSSDSSSSFDEEFLGFFSEEWSRDTSYHTSPENIVFFGKIVSTEQPIAGNRKPETKKQTNPLFRSTSDSFRYMRLKMSSLQSTSRSKSVPERNRLASSPSKSRWQVFVFGFGSGKFPAKMDMSDIKSRQLRRQSTRKVTGGEESGGRRCGKKGWWRLVDVLGCGGGHVRDMAAVVEGLH